MKGALVDELKSLENISNKFEWIMNRELLPCLHRLQAPQGSRPVHLWRREVCEADE